MKAPRRPPLGCALQLLHTAPELGTSAAVADMWHSASKHAKRVLGEAFTRVSSRAPSNRQFGKIQFGGGEIIGFHIKTLAMRVRTRSANVFDMRSGAFPTPNPTIPNRLLGWVRK